MKPEETSLLAGVIVVLITALLVCLGKGLEL